MPIKQVDRAENGDVRRVWFEIKAGAHEGFWTLERFEKPDERRQIEEPGWELVRFPRWLSLGVIETIGGAPPDAVFFLPMERVSGPEEHVCALAPLLGWRMARAVFRRFGLISNPALELQYLRPQQPKLALIHGGNEER